MLVFPATPECVGMRAAVDKGSGSRRAQGSAPRCIADGTGGTGRTWPLFGQAGEAEEGEDFGPGSAADSGGLCPLQS